MRKLLIPDIQFTALDERNVPQKVSAAQQLQQFASVPSKPGETFTIDEIRERLPVVDKLAAAAQNGSNEVLLEDSEYATLMQAVSASTWMGVSRAALDLVKAVEDAETVKVAEVEPKPNRATRRRAAQQKA